MKNWLITIVTALVTGTFASFFYNTTYKHVHYGLVLSLLLIACVGLSIKYNLGRKFLSAYAVIIIILIVFFSAYGPFGDDLIIMGDTTGLIFVVAGCLIGPALLFGKKAK